MSVHAGCEDEYQRRHTPIWEELVHTLTTHGVHNYSIFLDRQTGDLLFAFSGRAHFQVFNLTGYEIWETTLADGTSDYSNTIMASLYEAAPRQN